MGKLQSSQVGDKWVISSKQHAGGHEFAGQATAHQQLAQPERTAEPARLLLHNPVTVSCVRLLLVMDVLQLSVDAIPATSLAAWAGGEKPLLLPPALLPLVLQSRHVSQPAHHAQSTPCPRSWL